MTEQTIKELEQRYRKLHTQKIQTETNLENAKERLAELKQQAQDQFGTDDVEELKEKLKQIKAENAQKRSDYEKALDRIDADLARVEKEYGSVHAEAESETLEDS